MSEMETVEINIHRMPKMILKKLQIKNPEEMKIIQQKVNKYEEKIDKEEEKYDEDHTHEICLYDAEDAHLEEKHCEMQEVLNECDFNTLLRAYQENNPSAKPLRFSGSDIIDIIKTLVEYDCDNIIIILKVLKMIESNEKECLRVFTETNFVHALRLVLDLIYV